MASRRGPRPRPPSSCRGPRPWPVLAPPPAASAPPPDLATSATDILWATCRNCCRVPRHCIGLPQAYTILAVETAWQPGLAMPATDIVWATCCNCRPRQPLNGGTVFAAGPRGYGQVWLQPQETCCQIWPLLHKPGPCLIPTERTVYLYICTCAAPCRPHSRTLLPLQPLPVLGTAQYLTMRCEPEGQSMIANVI